MANGFEVNISESDFKAKPAGEQNWILFQGVTSLHRDGCAWGQKKYKGDRLKYVSAMTGAVVFALGVIYIVYQMTCK